METVRAEARPRDGGLLWEAASPHTDHQAHGMKGLHAVQPRTTNEHQETVSHRRARRCPDIQPQTRRIPGNHESLTASKDS